MMNDFNGYNSQNNVSRDEIPYQDLIAIANNPQIFGTLQPETQQNLIEILRVYSEKVVANVMTGRYSNNPFNEQSPHSQFR